MTLLRFIVGRRPAFKHAFRGLKHVLLTQHNARIHVTATILVILLGFILKLEKSEWALVVIAIGLVWITEITNTAIEAFVDLVTQQYHPLAKIAKDTAAASVLFASFIAVILGMIVFLPHLIQWLASLNLLR